jgi:hypothetical protein
MKGIAMKTTLKLAAVSVMLAAAAGAFASQDDFRPDNAWLAQDIATQHMEPQVVILDTSPYSVTNIYAPTSAPVPMAAASDATVYVSPSVSVDAMLAYSEAQYAGAPITDNEKPVMP